MSPVRFAVIGCGKIAHEYHLPALCAIEEAEFVAACDIDERRARETEKRFDAQGHCTNYEQVTRRDDIDLICIFTKVDTHAQLAVAAAESGKHAFVQKPFARSIHEGRAMVEAARATGVQMIPSFMHRYFDECVAAAGLIREGLMGTVEFVRMRNATANPREVVASYGGALMDIGAHGIDLVRALTDQEVVRVSGWLSQYGEAPPPPPEPLRASADRVLLGAELNAWLHYELSSGTLVSHEVQWSQTAGTSRFQAEIYGTEGTVFLRVPRTREDLAYVSAVRPEREAEEETEWVVPQLPGRPMGQLHHETLIRSILTGEGSAQTAEDGLAVLRVCEAARRAAESSCWTDVL